MGMSIDEAMKEIESITVVTDEKQALAFALAVHTMKKYQTLQADYEARLKADLVAMLEDLNLQIEELEEIPPYDIMDDWEHQICVRIWEVKQIIKEKINTLKGENETC